MQGNFGPELVSRWLPRLTFGETAEAVLGRFSAQEASASALVEILTHNQLYASALRSYIRARTGGGGSSASDENRVELTLHRCVALLGVLGTRNLVLALRQIRALGEPWPYVVNPDDLRREREAKKGDAKEAAPKEAPPSRGKAGEKKEKFQPDQWISLALKAQEFCQSHQVPDPEGLGFAGGNLYDWVKHLAAREGRKKVDKAADEFFKRPLKFAFLASRLSEKTPGFGLGRFVFPAAHSLGAARYLLHCLTLNQQATQSLWTDFEKATEKSADTARVEARFLKEQKMVGMLQEEVAAMLLVASGSLRVAASGVRNMRSPMNLHAVDRGSFQLASILWLAHHMVDHGKALEAGKAPLSTWLAKPWCKSLRLKERDILESAKEAASLA